MESRAGTSSQQDDASRLPEILHDVNQVAENNELMSEPQSDVTSNDFDNSQVLTVNIAKVNFNEDKESPILLNTRPLEEYASTYELETFKYNILIIFNNENINGLKPREGTEKDVTALTETFSKVGFTVVPCKDYTKDQIIAKLDEFTHSTNDFSEYGCVAIAVLTHGSDHGKLRAKDCQYNISELTNYCKISNNQTLVTKPKIIIIQACRGLQISTGTKVPSTYRDVVDPTHNLLPKEADILILHSCYEGYKSHRDKESGSWFIQELCSKINELAPTKDLETIMKEVQREVAFHKYNDGYDVVTKELYTSKQMPVYESTLLRKLFLRKYGNGPPTMCATEVFTYSRIESIPFQQTPRSMSSQVMGLDGTGPSFVKLYSKIMRNSLELYITQNPQNVEAKNLWAFVTNDKQDTQQANNIAIFNFLTQHDENLNLDSSTDIFEVEN